METTKTEFCPGCKQLIDYALATPLRHKLYIEINPEVEAPDGRAAIPLCAECKTKLTEELGIDGFVIEIP